MQACLNGSRGTGEHPAVPTTPSACAAHAAAAVAAGADDLHVHPRTSDGRDSVVADDVAAWVRAIREVCDAPVGVTTGEWAWNGGIATAEAIRGWDVLPDHASVNWHETAATEVAAALVDQGVRLHAGLWTVDAVHQWLASPWRAHTACILLELPDSPDQERTARRLVDLVGETGIPILLHGEDRSAWPMLDCAAAWGLRTRIGLEDVVAGPAGEEVDGNAALLRIAAHR